MVGGGSLIDPMKRRASSLLLTPPQIKALLQARGIALKKRWGQNFLISSKAQQRIMASIEGLSSSSQFREIWEIGPGLGALTLALSQLTQRLVLYEIDYGLVRYLEEYLPQLEHYSDLPAQRNQKWERGILLYAGDALQRMPQLWQQGFAPDLLCGNLPYRSAAALLLACTHAAAPPPQLAFLLQREMAERLSAQPNRGSYSSFSVALQLYYEPVQQFPIGRHSFFPMPHVDSVFVILRRHHQYGDLPRHILDKLAPMSFASRRATLGNNLRRGLKAPELRRRLFASHWGALNLQRRAESLSVAEFVELARLLHRAGFTGD